MAPQPSSVPDLAEVGLELAPPHIASLLKQTLSDVLGENCNRFPGAQPVSFAGHHIEALKKRDYYVCEKSDGVRCLLFMTQDERAAEVQYFIDRKNNYYHVPTVLSNTELPGFHAPRAAVPGPDGKPGEIDYESFHTRTVLDGELLYDTYPDGRRVLKYLVFDCLTLDGEDLTARPLDKRLAYFMEKIWTPYNELVTRFPDDTQFLFVLEKKDFQLSYGTELMFKEIMPKLKHGCDGLIFTCRETPYHYGTDENILKWKPAEENSIDFRIKLEFPELTLNGPNPAAIQGQGPVWDRDYDAMPKVHLYVHRGSNEYIYFQEMYMEPTEWEEWKRYAVERNEGLDEAVVECHKDGQGRWRYLRFREDKNEGNHVSVVEKVQQSIDDAVSQQQLIKEAPEIRKFWKQRAAADQKGRR